MKKPTEELGHLDDRGHDERCARLAEATYQKVMKAAEAAEAKAMKAAKKAASAKPKPRGK